MNYTKLKKIYEDKGITNCELRFNDCWVNNALSFAHRHKRRWYLGQKKLLEDFNQTILACINCHQKIEYNKELTKEVFNRLRKGEL
jgi:hypothetical protein